MIGTADLSVKKRPSAIHFQTKTLVQKMAPVF